ncbi:hypothetical protein [Streptomyces sp. NPDC048603]|uniref:hypothetical protein n=1 Tax=Streptomyces sp. NPDC048603 TaxID=3365577 RepID=UPI0037148B54
MNEIPPQAVPAEPGPMTHPGYTVAPPPSKKKRILRGVALAVAGVAALVGGRLAMGALLGSDTPDDAGRYRLTPPASFQGLVLQDSGPRVDAIRQGQGAGQPGVERVAVVYADQSGAAQLVVSGAYGSFTDKDPGAELDGALRAMGMKEGQVKEYEAGQPDGGAMRCGPLATAAGTLSMCMWADHSTLVSVTVPVENKAPAMDELAEQSRALRTAMEVRS